MNILASIKSEKKMSFSHWRYRILHWCFSETATNPDDSFLPPFLYTHYCPLFHLTNIIAVFLPFIFILKIIASMISAIIIIFRLVPWRTINNCLETVQDWWYTRCHKTRRAPKTPKEPTEQERAAKRLKEEQRIFLDRMLRSDPNSFASFDSFWSYYGYDIVNFEKDDAEEFYDTRMAKINATRERVAERKEKMKQRLIFWTQFSEVFFKWFFNICYILLAIFVAWTLYKITPPIISAIIYIIKLSLTFEILPFLAAMGIILFRVAAITIPILLVIYITIKFRVVRKCGTIMATSVSTTLLPFKLLGRIIVAPFIWIAKSFEATLDFIEMFYHENCPPIQIVSGEDEIIANELGEDE